MQSLAIQWQSEKGIASELSGRSVENYGLLALESEQRHSVKRSTVDRLQANLARLAGTAFSAIYTHASRIDGESRSARP